MNTSATPSSSAAAASSSGSGAGARFRRILPARRASQLFTLALLVLVPVTGLFHINVADGAIVVLDRQIWFSDFFIIFGFWIMIASILVMSYSLAGAVFCGWVCPQGSASEWANALTYRLLGRKAEVMDFSGKPMQVARRKDSWRNKALLFSILWLMAMFYAVIPLLYFYPPAELWRVVTMRAEHAGSVLWIYAVFTVILFLDIGMIRHMVCRYMCIYRMWQHSFKTRDTLHVAYDDSRAADCANCHYCADSCYLELDPRNTVVYDSCINCGDCIDACNELHARSRKLSGPGLLRFEMGDPTGERGRGNVGSFFSRVRVALPVAVFGGLMFWYGLSSYEPHHMSVFRAENAHQGAVRDYQINIANKLYRPADFTVRVGNLPDGAWRLSRDKVHMDTAGRANVRLHVGELPKGLYNVRVTVRASDGWTGSFLLRHFSPGVKS